MKLPIREILFALLLLGIPTGAWCFVFKPSNVHHAEMREQISLKQEKLRKLNRLVGTVGELKKEISSLEQAIAFFQSKLPCAKEMDKVLQEIWRLAEKHKLVTKSIRTFARRKNEKSFYTSGSQVEQPINISLEGNFKGFYAFLQDLESQQRIMRISRMDLKKPEECRKSKECKKSTEGSIQVNFEMSIFFEPGE